MRTLLLLLLFVSSFAYAQPPINTPSPYVVCDDDNDGIACSFILSTKDAEISTQPGIQISYYTNLTDSLNGTNPIFNVSSGICGINGAIVYVRVVDPADPNNPSFTTLNLVVNPKPNFTLNNPPTICMGQSAYIELFNMGSNSNFSYAWITPPGTPSPGNVSSFSTTEAGIYTVIITDLVTSCTASYSTTVTMNLFLIPTFSIPTTICTGAMSVLPTTSLQGVIGTWSPSTLTVGTNSYLFTPYPDQCATDVSINITVIESPTANQAPNLMQVDNPYDGFATFDLTSQNAIINSNLGLQFTYFQSIADAQNNTNAIPNPASYTNLTNPQTIYVSILDPVIPDCTAITSFQIIATNPNIVYIPDTNFKAKLITLGVDTNTDGNIQFSEATAVTTELNVNSSLIADLTGFEAFTNVPILRCTNNNLSTLNLSNLPNLKIFECGLNSNLSSINLTNLASLDTLRLNSNNLSSLNVNNLTSLKHLDCSYNHISSLNVSNLTNLKILNCASNWLTTIDVSPLTLLEELNCSMNQLATINVVPLVNLKTLICSNNGIHSLSLNNLPNLEHLEYGNNQSTSLTFSNLPTMKYLDCAGNSIVTLNASVLPLLEYLDCSGNHLTSINVNGLTHLSYFSFALNQVDTINFSGLSNLSYLNCTSNLLTSLVLTGLINLDILFASSNSIPSIILGSAPNLTMAYLDFNQLTSLDLTGLSHLHTLAVNNNQLSSLNLTGLVNLIYLDCHENLISSVNFSGLTNLATALCEHNLFTSLDFSGAPNFNNLGCGYNPNLTSINIKNGNPNINFYSYWVDTPSLTFVCADNDELSYIQQILTQSLHTNVVLNTYCSFTPGGVYNTITGHIIFDGNNNGCDANDPVLPKVKVEMTQWGINNATFSNNNGLYVFYTTFADQSVTPVFENANYFTISPANATVSFPETNFLTQTQDFCITPNGNHQDLEIVIQPINVARPGFDATYKIVYKNKGNTMVSGSLDFNYNDALLDYVSATVTPSSQNTGQLVWNYTNLVPFETRSFYVTLNVNSPVETPPVNIGTLLDFNATINPIVTDENQADNQITYTQMVIGSYDPNEITCLEGDNLPTSEIGKYLHYGITFENTGNYYAENVVVKDVIDTAKYDINSIQLLDNSHPVYTRITGNVVEFIFKNINLAAADGNPPVGGHGDVLFKIKSLSNLVNGDVVTKSAKIYFDYNAPIETNAAQTTYQNLSNSIHQLDSSISIYPNPTNSFVTINCNSNIKSIELYDVQGRILETSIENNTTSKLDISDKQNGIYFVKINTENGSKVEKIVKE